MGNFVAKGKKARVDPMYIVEMWMRKLIVKIFEEERKDIENPYLFSTMTWSKYRKNVVPKYDKKPSYP